MAEGPQHELAPLSPQSPLSALMARVAAAEPSLGVDSLPQHGVPKGTVTKRTWNASRFYREATHEYWVYVPAQYAPSEPASVMVFQDGFTYVDSNGLVRAPTVFDNLISKGEMPVAIGIFVNPGMKEVFYDQRQRQYVALDDTYVRYLLDEIFVQVGNDYNLVDDAAGRAIAGMSDGGLCAFTAAWERPDVFSKVISHVGSFTRPGLGAEYPPLIRASRGKPKPIRVFLQDGMNDLNITTGNWPLANLAMESALKFARYDYRFEIGAGGHDLIHGGAIFPDTLRWIWRDYPGVRRGGAADALDSVIGRWDVVTDVFGHRRRSALTIAVQDGALAVAIDDEVDGKIEVSGITFEDGILSYEYVPPASQSQWGKGTTGTMKAWLRVAGSTIDGALTSTGTDTEFDFWMVGQRRIADGQG